MITISRKLEIRWKNNASYFNKANVKNLNDTEYPRRIGSSVNAVKAMTVRGHEMKVLMPSLLGIDPSSKTGYDWETAVNRYWNGLTVLVPSGGLPIETGFIFDFNDTDKTNNITALRKSLENKVDLSTEQLFAEYVMEKVKEEEKYLYGMPINTADYLLWRYCQNYRDVANSPDSNKGSRVRFYIYDEKDAETKRKLVFRTQQEALRLYFDLITKPTDKKNVLWVLGIPAKGKDDYFIDSTLKNEATVRPEQFIALVNDANLKTKAEIERLIGNGILKRVPNTSVIVDASDPSVVIGNNMDEAVTYWSVDTPVNKQNIANFAIKLKSLKQ